ncbi:MAG: SNF2 helicase associated domain-containing protein [Deltaproteobacteria bacterium]|nr:SNF2 helicase associated domain-containing protein [Deltaproteobacteria bacterium]
MPAVSSWRARLDQIQGVSGGRPANTFAGTWLAFFVVNAAETIASSKLVLDLWTRDRLSNGGLGPLKPNRMPNGGDLTRFTDVRDREVLSVLARTCDPQTFAPFGRASGNMCSRFTVDPILETHLLPSLTSAGKLFLSRSPNGSPDDADRPIRMDRGKAWDLELKIEAATPEHYRLGGLLKRDNETRGLNEPLCIFRSSFLLFADRMGKLSDPRQVAWASALRSTEEFLVPRDQGDLVLRRILTDPAVPKVTWPDDMGWQKIVIDPKPKGVFRPLGISGERMTLTVSFDYAGHEMTLNDTAETFIDVDQKRVISRNPAFEEKTLTDALKILRDDQGTGTFPSPELHRVASELTAAGWTVYMENQKLLAASDFAMNVSTDTDWFDLKMEASFGNAAIGQNALLAALEAKQGFVRLADGSLGMLPQEWISRFASIGQFGEKSKDGTLRFNKSQGLMLNAALGPSANVKADKGFSSFRERIQKFEGVKEGKAPKGFKGKLRNYQKEGLAWLEFVEEFQMGGILADDMGLGKTIQVLAFLKGREKKTDGPALVIAPKSLVFNWLDEAERFVPELKVVAYSGPGRSKILKDLSKADLVVTTYGTLRTDIEKLRDVNFDVAIVDEAQAIKNPEAQSSMAVKQLNAAHKLALTGTPIENSLSDLFSILEFTSPGLLNIPKTREVNSDARQMLQRMLGPFVLRRTKEKVLTELPEKSEQVLYCEMSTEERTFYNALRDHYRASLAGEIDKGGLGKAKIHVLEALLRLRQAACHPGLINPDMKAEASAKLSLLTNHVQEVIQEGHKALVFSQFTSLLALVKDQFDQAGIVYEYLDGQTDDRKAPVERFQTDPKCQAFLISLKAGGTGLNLTAADYVFILDPWWNPAVEAQAIGRAHRIGQQQKVFAYRMIAKGTVEEKILDLQKTKRELAESILSEDQDFIKKLTREDLELLLQ